MKNSVFTVFSFLLFPWLLFAQEETIDSTSSTQLDIQGEWLIDLRPSKDAAAYLQTFTIKIVKKNSFSGRFYGSPLQNVVLNKNWNKLYFAFMTEDASNRYYHTGYFLNGNVYGMTYCPNRQFAMPWNGAKIEK